MTKKPILAVIVFGLVAVAIFAGYWWLFGEATPPEPDGLRPAGFLEGGLTDTAQANDQFLRLIAAMQRINLTDEFLTSPLFLRGLQDHSVVLQRQPKGRPNPFLPIGVEAAAVASTSGSSASTTNRR